MVSSHHPPLQIGLESMRYVNEPGDIFYATAERQRGVSDESDQRMVVQVPEEVGVRVPELVPVSRGVERVQVPVGRPVAGLRLTGPPSEAN